MGNSRGLGAREAARPRGGARIVVASGAVRAIDVVDALVVCRVAEVGNRAARGRAARRAVAAHRAIGVHLAIAPREAHIRSRIRWRAPALAGHVRAIRIARAFVVRTRRIAGDGGCRKAAPVDAHRAVRIVRAGERRPRVVVARSAEGARAPRDRTSGATRSVVGRNAGGIDVRAVRHAGRVRPEARRHAGRLAAREDEKGRGRDPAEADAHASRVARRNGGATRGVA
jgi:hypothetical protein